MNWQKYLGIAVILLAYTALAALAGWALRGEKVQKQIVHVQEQQAKEVGKVEEKRRQREIVYRDRVKVIHESNDDCLSQPVPDDILRALRPGSE
jgi:hypothetical protein